MHQAEISGEFKGKYIKIHRSFPSSWREMTDVHLDKLAEVLTSGEKEEFHAKMILFRWLRIPYNIFRNIDAYYIEQLSKQLEFLFKENDLNKVHVKKFTHRGIEFYGPKDGFINISFLEWVVAENHFQKYQQSKKEIDLNCLIYSLYRPIDRTINEDSPDFKDDFREMINEYTIEKKSEIFSDLPKKERMKALITYIGNRNTVMNRFKPVFEDVERKGIVDPYKWSGILVDMTGTKWITRDLVEREKVYNIFIHWHQNILRMEEYEMEMENAKK